MLWFTATDAANSNWSSYVGWNTASGFPTDHAGASANLNQSIGKAASVSSAIAATPYARPASKHPGGFVAAMCDGSVKNLSQDIGYQVYTLLMTPNGNHSKDPGTNSTPTTYFSAWMVGGTPLSSNGSLIPLSDSMLTQ